MKDIGDRIKALRKENKYSQQFVAEKLSISQSAYSLIESAHNNVMVNHVLTLAELYDVSTDYILHGKKNLVETSTGNGFLPFIHIEAVAGNLDALHDVHGHNDWDWYRIPGLKPSPNHLLFEVDGDSMQPTFFNKDVIICEAQDDIKDLSDNDLVVIGTEEGLLTKRFKNHDSDYCYLLSDNKNYQPVKLRRKEIKAAMLVKGKVTRTLNARNNDNENKNKFENMEHNIKNLESQIERLSKQMK